MDLRSRQDLERTLDQHGSFVRRLAGSLVFDENRAADVGQETWLAAARHPPRDKTTIRGWLATVVRNFSFRVRRDEARRIRREERAARPEACSSPAANPAEAAMLREVIEAVLALDEPYRSTVLMKFYENLDPTEIAARLAIPAATVRTRLRRALDQLRDRFDARHGGDRRAWTVPLVPMALGALEPVALAASAVAAGTAAISSTPALSGITLGGILMAKKVGIICGLLSIAVVSVVIATRSGDAASDSDKPHLPIVDIVEAPEPPEALPGEPATGAPIAARPYVPGEEDRVAAEIVLAPAGAPSATIRGRVLDRQGAAQGNVPVTLRTSHRTSEEDLTFMTEVSNEGQLQTRTGADGRFVFAQLPLNMEASIHARPDKLCDVTRPTSITKPGVIDVGDLIAVPGGSIAGVVLGPQGTPVKNCQVTAWSIDGAASSGVSVLRFRRIFDPDARSAVTNASGQYRIDGLPPGACGAAAASDDHPSASRNAIPVRANDVTWEIDFKLSPGVALAGVVRDAEGRPLQGASVKATPSELRLDAAEAIGDRARTATTGADGRFVLQGLRPEPMSVRARKPGFVAATQRDAVPGTEVSFTLRPSGLAFGRVRNALTNEPVASFSLNVVRETFGDGIVRARVVRGAEAAKAAEVAETPDLFAVLDLPESPVSFQVRAEEFADAEVVSVRAAAGDKTEVNVLLTPQAAIRGVVVDPSGNPVDGAKVSIRNSKSGHVTTFEGGGAFQARRRVVSRGEGPVPADEPAVARSAVSAADGSFTIKSLPAGGYRLSATHSVFAAGTSTEVIVKPSETVEGVRVVMELGGTFAGRTLDAEGNKLAGARIAIRPKGARSGPLGMHGTDGRDPAISDAEGEFAISGLRAGEYLAALGEDWGDAIIHVAILDDDEKARQDEIPITIEAGKTVRKDLQQKPRALLGGLVKEGGKPAAGVKVSLAAKGVPDFFGQNSTQTDENGVFAFDKVAPGDYNVLVDPRGAPLPIRRPVTLAPRSDQRITIDLPTGAIEGRVTDRASGKPIAGVSITASIERVPGAGEEPEATSAIMITATADDEMGAGHTISFGGPSEAIRTDADGRFRLRYLQAGNYRVSIRGEGVMAQSKSGVAVDESRTTRDVDFGAEKGATLIVSIDPAGHDVNDVFGFVNLEGTQDGHDVKGGSVKKGITFTGLKPGRYHVRVDAPMNDLDGQADVDVVSGQEARVTIRLAERQ